MGVSRIDRLVGTHPHVDHIGQFPQVIETFDVREVWMSGDTHTTQTCERALDAILESEADYHEPHAGESYTFGSLLVEVIHPESLGSHFHDGSVSLRAIFCNVALVSTGDAEVEAERSMIARGHDVRAQILKLGHHGSSTSSCQVFLSAIGPEVAIYSAADGNTYGHPHDEVINRLAAMNIPVYGTDVHGTIVVTSDGHSYTVTPARHGQVSVGNGVVSEPDPEPPHPSDAAPDGGCAPSQVNINTASKEELMQIIHIGETRANGLISLRPFASVSELGRISGIGQSRLEDIIEEGIVCLGH